MTQETIQSIEDFLYREASLLDKKLFDNWFDLYTDDACYWIPLRPEQSQRDKELSIISDDIDMMRARVHWLKHPKNHAQALPSRTMHYISNVLVDNFDENKQEYLVSSALQVIEFREDKQTIYAGSCEHVLRLCQEEMKIASKRIDLINSEGFLNSISIPL